MIKVDDIHSLSDFQRNTKSHITRLKKTGQPAVLTVNGRAELVVFDAATFQTLSEKIERAEAIEGIQRGLEQADAGSGRPIRKALEALRKEHRIARAS